MASAILASATPLLALCALACPVGMGAMMWFMARGSRSKEAPPVSPATLDDLREEHERLGTQIESLEDSRSDADQSEPAIAGRAIGVTTAGARDTLAG
ncbi:MAG TPA: hypothetical protein VK538_01925 [Solirubrobacteraceae bacterium]|nr:hypothetical protein [Solirubrobacteraceae bacterium]